MEALKEHLCIMFQPQAQEISSPGKYYTPHKTELAFWELDKALMRTPSKYFSPWTRVLIKREPSPVVERRLPLMERNSYSQLISPVTHALFSGNGLLTSDKCMSAQMCPSWAMRLRNVLASAKTVVSAWTVLAPAEKVSQVSTASTRTWTLHLCYTICSSS